ncbi:iron-siderophore ABC transporter substrate-binding protein [Plantactinospora soyae]|uniref:Iron complex transport system substrate-binding protein n=1 Tax=Plantactinospora soyae TaxID=1544732 RepID=A0A927ME02_9ACTN|nr:iron-siderophore ABC transporter substrate-binding protein [Plantactinospora soyae]MBE1490013.1 iron complex transport system substrate-binding protein [Plantactinospora soyae]
MSSTPARATRLGPVARLAAALVVLALGLAGCGDTGGDDPAPAATSGAFPVRIDHKYGATEITKQPTRVVTLGLSDQDPVLALGTVPVGAIDWFLERPYGKWPWVQPLWGSTPPEIVGERDDYNMEKIAALRPDLIIGLYSGMTQEQYGQLSKLAPTVAQPKGFEDYAAPWQDMTRLAGRALGRPEQADKLIADVDARFAKARQEHPGYAGRTVAVVDPYEAGKYAVFAPSDPKVVFMTQLGFTVPDTIVQAVGKEYAAEIGSERLDLVNVDKLLFLTSDGSAEPRVKADKVYSSLDVAKQNRAVFLPYENPPLGGALSFSTVLSVPYALDQILPLLGDG